MIETRTLGVDIDAKVLPVGAKLVRYYNGRAYHVHIVKPLSAISPAAQRRGWWRYLFGGTRKKTLTAIAFEITGDRFLSGHRFFGLRRRRRGHGA